MACLMPTAHKQGESSSLSKFPKCLDDHGAFVGTVRIGFNQGVEHGDKKVKALSGGTRRKLSAAIAMACGRPDVVFLDEPTTGVDSASAAMIMTRGCRRRPAR